jgi:hypothetical protein
VLQLDVVQAGVWTTLKEPCREGRMLTSLTALDVVRIYCIPKVQNMLGGIVTFHTFTTIQWYRQSCLLRYIHVFLILILPNYVYVMSRPDHNSSRARNSPTAVKACPSLARVLPHALGPSLAQGKAWKLKAPIAQTVATTDFWEQNSSILSV